MKQNLQTSFVIMLLCTTMSFAQSNCDNITISTINIGPSITLCDNESTDPAVVTTASNLPTMEYLIVDLDEMSLDGLGPAIIGVDDDGAFVPADLGITGERNIAIIPISYNIQDFRDVVDAVFTNTFLGAPCCSFVDAIYPNFCTAMVAKGLTDTDNINGLADIIGILDLVLLTSGKDSVEGLVYKIILLENLIKAIPDECLEPMSLCYAISPTRQVYIINETPVVGDVSETAPGQITVNANLTGGGTMEYALDPNGPWQTSNVFNNVPPSGLVYVRNVGTECMVAFPYETVSLAAELVYFEANIVGTTNLLEWKTATESNNEGFSIYRAANGVDFEKIGWVAGTLNSTTTQAYQYRDTAPLFGKNYYTLSMEDTDGSITFSDVVVVSRMEAPNRFNVLAVQNSVANDMLQVTFSNTTTGVFDFIIYDANGRLAMQGKDTVLEGINNFMLDVSTLNPSIYIFAATKGGFNISEKIVIH